MSPAMVIATLIAEDASPRLAVALMRPGKLNLLADAPLSGGDGPACGVWDSYVKAARVERARRACAKRYHIVQ